MKKKALLISLLSLLSALFFNETNFHVLKTQYPAEFEKRCTVGTSDDASYITPPENFLKGKGWRTNDVGTGAWVFRAPGYGLFVLLCKITAGENVFCLLRYLQLLLFALSVYLFCLSAFIITGNRSLSLLFSCIYGILPLMHGFIYYTLTEGITPFLVMLYSYFILLSLKEKSTKKLYISSIILALLIIVRPQLLLLYVAMLPFYYELIKSKALHQSRTIILTTLISFSLLMLWQGRNYKIAHRWVPLLAVYHPDNNSIFRPQHAAICEFYKSFGAEGSVFHENITTLWKYSLSGDTATTHINEIMHSIPDEVTACIGKTNLSDAFRLYQQCSYAQRLYTQQNIPMPSIKYPQEEGCVAAFDSFRKKVFQCHPVEANVIVPAKVFYKLAAHSNLSLQIFQYDWRGKWWMEILRWICFIIHSSVFVFLLLQLLFRMDKMSGLLFLAPMLYIAYICFFQVMIEERYSLPLLPLLLLGTVRIIQLLLYKKNQIRF